MVQVPFWNGKEKILMSLPGIEHSHPTQASYCAVWTILSHCCQ